MWPSRRNEPGRRARVRRAWWNEVSHSWASELSHTLKGTTAATKWWAYAAWRGRRYTRQMTVAAIVLVPDKAVALTDADGEPAIRRVVHSAWSGGAMPIVIVSDDG